MNIPDITINEVLQFFKEHQLNLKKAFFNLLSEDKIEMLEKFKAKIGSMTMH